MSEAFKTLSFFVCNVCCVPTTTLNVTPKVELGLNELSLLVAYVVKKNQGAFLKRETEVR